MTDSQQKPAKFLRSCILYEALERKDVFEAYKHFCKVFGDDAMDYLDFDFWFYRFYHGDYDLDFERPIAGETEPKPRLLLDLKSEILEKVMEKLDLIDHLVLRKVSRKFQTLIDNRKPAYEKIIIFCESYKIVVGFDKKKVIYTDGKFLENGYKEIRGEDYLQMAFNDVAIALKNPKLHLDYFHIDYHTQLRCHLFNKTSGEKSANWIYENLHILLKSLKHKISVKSVMLTSENQKQLLTILPYLKPGILEEISLDDANYSTKNYHKKTIMDVDELITLDQWRQAKEIFTQNLLLSVPVANFSHCIRFSVNLTSISLEDLVCLRDTLLKSAEFDYCCLVTEKKLIINNNVGKLFSSLANDNNPEIRDYPIPNTEKVLEFKFSSDKFIDIERKSRFGSP